MAAMIRLAMADGCIERPAGSPPRHPSGSVPRLQIAPAPASYRRPLIAGRSPLTTIRRSRRGTCQPDRPLLGILSLLVIVTLSILITRIAELALTRTRSSREASRFQARSAPTSSGFTTNESEQVVNRPGRRRIVMTRMIVGDAGVIIGVTSRVLTRVDDAEDGASGLVKVLILVAGQDAVDETEEREDPSPYASRNSV